MRTTLFAAFTFFLGLNLAFSSDLEGTNGCTFTAPNVHGDANIGNPLIGDIVFDTSTNGFYGYAGSSWVVLGSLANPNHAPTVQKFTSGSGVYTTPAGVLYIRVEMVGGGGGGAGSSGSSAGTAGGTGGTTTFGTSLLSATGGGPGQLGSDNSLNTGGVGSLGTGPIGIAVPGGYGSPGMRVISGAIGNGGTGGMNPFGGAGSGGGAALVGDAGATNTGAGGGGAGGSVAGTTTVGSGGGAGGYVKAMIASPASTYSYSVGAAGTAGAAGSGGGFAGGAGGSGVILVEEYYQ